MADAGRSGCEQRSCICGARAAHGRQHRQEGGRVGATLTTHEDASGARSSLGTRRRGEKGLDARRADGAKQEVRRVARNKKCALGRGDAWQAGEIWAAKHRDEAVRAHAMISQQDRRRP
jgi:hypothetical protein